MSILQTEIRKLRLSEDIKRREHVLLQDSLQDTWDKLVNLRSHISLFKSAIEEVKLEEAAFCVYALNEANLNTSELTSEMATRLGSLHALREKVRLKESLKTSIALIDEKRISGQRELTRLIGELSKINELSSNVSTSSYSQQYSNILNIIDQHRTEDSLSIKSELFATQKKNELLESEYISKVSELERLEFEINEVLKWNPDLSDNNNNIEKQTKDIEASLDRMNENSNNTNAKNQTYCPISLHEILSGQGHILRINGEAPLPYRMRLEKRLHALLALDSQLQSELDSKNSEVLKIRNILKDLELSRLRKELELSTIGKQRALTSGAVDSNSPEAAVPSGLLPDSNSIALLQSFDSNNSPISPIRSNGQGTSNLVHATHLLKQDLFPPLPPSTASNDAMSSLLGSYLNLPIRENVPN